MKQLIANGFVREIVYSEKTIGDDETTIPMDIIKLISIWIHFIDTLDPKLSHPKMLITHEFLSVNDDDENIIGSKQYECVERGSDPDRQWFHSYGTDVIEKGQKKRWEFKILHNHDSLKIGIIDVEYALPDIENFKKKKYGYGLSFGSGMHGWIQ